MSEVTNSNFKEYEARIALIVTIAKVCHEANKAFCESIGDNSQVSWEEAEEWQKESSRNGVLFVLGNSNVTAETIHQNWVNDKLKAGWVYGPVKDPAKKTHPSMVEFSKLSDNEKYKDKLFVAIVRALQ